MCSSWNENLRSASWPNRTCLFGGKEELYVCRVVKYRRQFLWEKPSSPFALYHEDGFFVWRSLIRHCSSRMDDSEKEPWREYQWLGKREECRSRCYLNLLEFIKTDVRLRSVARSKQIGETACHTIIQYRIFVYKIIKLTPLFNPSNPLNKRYSTYITTI